MTTAQPVLKFYVSGPVGKRTAGAIDRWRHPIQTAIRHLDHEALNFVIDAPEDKQRTPQEIVAADLHLIDECDALIAYVDNGLSAGSCMEIFYCAHVLRRPVYVIDCTGERNSTRKSCLPKWIAAHATKVYKRGEFEGCSLHDFIIRRTLMACEHATTVAGLKRLEAQFFNEKPLTCEDVKRLEEYLQQQGEPGQFHRMVILNGSLDLDGKVVAKNQAACAEEMHARTATEEKTRGTWPTVRKDTLEHLQSLQADLQIAGRVLPFPEGYGMDDRGGLLFAGPLSKSRDSWLLFKSRAEAVIAMWIQRENGRKTASEAGFPG